MLNNVMEHYIDFFQMINHHFYSEQFIKKLVMKCPYNDIFLVIVKSMWCFLTLFGKAQQSVFLKYISFFTHHENMLNICLFDEPPPLRKCKYGGFSSLYTQQKS